MIKGCAGVNRRAGRALIAGLGGAYGTAGCGESFPAGTGIIRGSEKLSLSDSSHLTAEVPAGKLGHGLLNFNTHKDCSWHVR